MKLSMIVVITSCAPNRALSCPAAPPTTPPPNADAATYTGSVTIQGKPGGSSKPTVKVGSDGFDEAKVMAEAYAQVLEANGYAVNRDGIGLGGRKQSVEIGGVGFVLLSEPGAPRSGELVDADDLRAAVEELYG